MGAGGYFGRYIVVFLSLGSEFRFCVIFKVKVKLYIVIGFRRCRGKREDYVLFWVFGGGFFIFAIFLYVCDISIWVSIF